MERRRDIPLGLDVLHLLAGGGGGLALLAGKLGRDSHIKIKSWLCESAVLHQNSFQRSSFLSP